MRPRQLGIFRPALDARNGMVTIPEGPGSGVEICSSWLENAERRITELQ
jgi:hypothetical protein